MTVELLTDAVYANVRTLLTVHGLPDGYTIVFVEPGYSPPCFLAMNRLDPQGGTITGGNISVVLPLAQTYLACVALNPMSSTDFSVSSATLNVTSARSAQPAASVLSVTIPSVFGALLLLGVTFSFLLRQSNKHANRRTSLLIKEVALRRAIDENIMDVCLEDVEESVNARSHLISTMKAMGVASTSQATSARMRGEIRSLVMGEAQAAAHGVQDLMQVDIDANRVQMARGLLAIEEEFEAFRDASLPPKERADADTPWWGTRDVAEEGYECMRYVLHERAGSSDKLFSNSPFPRDCDANGVRADRRDEASGEGMALLNFCHHEDAISAKLTPPHVAAIRIYSTAAFKVINGPLRDAGRSGPHPLPVTVSFLAEAIGKLRAVGADQPLANRNLDLWRGMKDLQTTEEFEARGGTERAPMSTTTELKVALEYSEASSSLLFKLRTESFMGRGARIQFLSAFPGEAEVLFPPLTYMKPTGKVEKMQFGDRSLVVCEVVPTLGAL